jgi:hypothetical protein
VHSLESELRQLQTEGALDGPVAAHAIAVQRREVFSVYEELRATWYTAVVLVVTGVGILIKGHLAHVGPLAVSSVLALAAGACYVPAVRAARHAESPSTSAEYLLLLGALLLSADLGYVETQFHWFGGLWPRYLLILTALHGLTAYLLKSRLVIALALSSLAGWFGIERGPGSLIDWQSATTALGMRALFCAALVWIWREIDARLNAARFHAAFEHFAANLAFWGALVWCTDAHLRWLGALTVLGLAGLTIRIALKSGRELFAVYGVLYAALGICIVIGQIVNPATPAFAVTVLAVVLAAVVLLRQLHGRLPRAEA